MTKVKKYLPAEMAEIEILAAATADPDAHPYSADELEAAPQVPRVK